MKQKIRILPEQLCNQIAAGEVVERPSSVVKELVENSLDAGAGEIRIEVERGGKKLIRVIDDGSGMGRDDLFLCLERHATSKINSEADLFHLDSLGFRGEALPSISAISRMKLQSRSREAGEGWEIYAEGGTVKRAGALGIPEGTAIEVRDLFFNTPARRKFLKKDETELGHIAEVVTRLALARPAVQFRLVHNDRTLIEAYRQASLPERIAALLGRPAMEGLVPVSTMAENGISLDGFISRPDVNRATSGFIYTFVNGRYVRDRVVQHAILEGYRNFMPRGRYPVAVLFLNLDPGLVDVNVHPTKHEVRFREQSSVHDFLAGALREALKPSGWLAGGGKFPEGKTGNPIEGLSSTGTTAREPVPTGRTSVMPNAVAARLEGVKEAVEAYGKGRVQSGRRANGADGLFVFPEKQPEEKRRGFFSSLEVIGQYHRSYIICQENEDLVLIDQHAAHERIAFERLKAQYRKGKIEGQALLFPAVLELDFRGAALLEENLEELARLGFDLESFGPRSFALQTVPRVLGAVQAERLVREVAEELAEIGKSGLAEEALDNVLILMACHGVIRANRHLSGPEITALLSDLDEVDFSSHCPHGRPVMKRLVLGDIERMFKRT
jgi:DNA mismatch repair protein MutL